jgi:hypothetical protein
LAKGQISLRGTTGSWNDAGIRKASKDWLNASYQSLITKKGAEVQPKVKSIVASA